MSPDQYMDIDKILSLIPSSQSDLLLRQWGFDLVREYFSVAEQLPPTDAPVVELATGTGRMCAVLSCLFPMNISGDISLRDLPRAQQRIPVQWTERVHFVQLDMEHLPFRSDGISTLVCMNTLHEVSDPLTSLQEMVRVIHQKGILAVGDFNRTGFDAMRKIHEIVYHNDHHEGVISHREIETVMTASFRSVRSFVTPLNITYLASNKR